MRGILTVFRKEFVENLRDRRILLSALVFGPVLGPLMLAAILQLSVSRGEATFEEQMTLPVIGAEHAPNLVAVLESQNIKVEPRTLDESQIREAIADREITVALRDGDIVFEDNEVIYTSVGDGTTSEGEFWEAMNTICNLKLPVLVMVEDNGYAISTPVEVNTAGGSIS